MFSNFCDSFNWPLLYYFTYSEMVVTGLMDPIRFCLGAEIGGGNDEGILQRIWSLFQLFPRKILEKFRRIKKNPRINKVQ